MSTAAVGATSLYSEIQSFFQTRQSDLTQLGNALQSGNLSDAQTAYNALVTLGQGGPFANGDPFRNSTRESDFAAIGQALQAGNLSDAQTAFSQLESTFQQGNGQASATPSNAASGQTTPEVVINLSGGSSPVTPGSTTPVTTLPNITINVGGNSNTPEQITLDLNNTANGETLTVSAAQGNQTPEQVTLNLAQNSNEQIVLNLLNSVANSSTTTENYGVSVVA